MVELFYNHTCILLKHPLKKIVHKIPRLTKTLKNKNNLTEIKMYKPLFYLSFPGQYFSLSFIEFDIVKKKFFN